MPAPVKLARETLVDQTLPSPRVSGIRTTSDVPLADAYSHSSMRVARDE
jgi:hypothetical protein